MQNRGLIAASDAMVLKIGSALTVLSGFILFLMAIFVTMDVLMRYFLNTPIKGSIELSQIIMAYVIFLGLSYTLGMNKHIIVDLFTMRLPPRAKLWCELFSFTIGLVVISIFAYASFGYFWFSWSIKETMGAIYTIYAFIGKFAMIPGLVLMALQFLTRLGVIILKLRSPVVESE